VITTVLAELPDVLLPEVGAYFSREEATATSNKLLLEGARKTMAQKRLCS